MTIIYGCTGMEQHGEGDKVAEVFVLLVCFICDTHVVSRNGHRCFKAYAFPSSPMPMAGDLLSHGLDPGYVRRRAKSFDLAKAISHTCSARNAANNTI